MKGPPRGPGEKQYEVGYGKPPKHTRFQKGRSGNPAGRPKGKKKSFRSEIEEELRQFIGVREEGRSYRVSKQCAIAKKLVALALQGDLKALTLLQSLRPPDPSARSEEESAAEVAAVRRLLAEAAREEDEPGREA